jgi:hypothetical protein
MTVKDVEFEIDNFTTELRFCPEQGHNLTSNSFSLNTARHE